MSDTLVVVPTYNEAESLPRLVAALRAQRSGVDLLVVDDGSPDGTGELADRLAEGDADIHVLHHAGKSGLARAYVDGFAWAGARGYSWVAQMDADGSHRPADLVKLLARRRGPDAPDLVIGSRWVRGGRIVGWSKRRELLSRAGNLYIRAMLGMPVRDATAGFRIWSTDALRRFRLTEQVEASGYGFQVNMTYAAWRAGARIVEVPITFVERAFGESKISTGIALEELRVVTRWGLARLRRGPRPVERTSAQRRR